MKKIFILILILNSFLFATEKIKVLMPSNFLPYFDLDENNKPIGFSIDVLNEVAKKADLEIEYVIKSNYVEVEKAHINKEAHLIATAGINEKRKENSIFTVPFSINIIRAYKLKDNPINSIDDIKNHRLVLKSNNISVKHFKFQDKDKLKFVNTKEEAILSLLSKESDVFVFNDNAMDEVLKKVKFDKLIVPFGEPVLKVDFAIRVHKDYPQLANKLNDSLIDFMSTSKFKAIKDKWILGIDSDTLNTNDSITNNSSITTKKVFLGNVNYEPYLFEKDGEFKGYIYDLVRAALDKTNLDADIVLMDWAKAQELVKNKKKDALININISEKRLKLYDFSTPLLESQFVLFKQKNRNDISGIESLYGKTIAVEKKGHAIEVLQKHPQINIKIVDTWADAFDLLSQGKVDGVLNEKIVSLYILHKKGITNIDYVKVPYESSFVYVAVNKGNSELLNEINNGLLKIEEDGTKAKITKKWNFEVNQLSLSALEKEYLNNNIFNICTQNDYYPYDGVINGRLVGIMGEYFTEISKLTGLKYNVIYPNSALELNELESSGKCDLLTVMGVDSPRFKNLSSADAFMKTDYTLVSSLKATHYGNDPKSFENLNIYVLYKGEKKGILEEYPNLNVIVENDKNKIAQKLLENNLNTFASSSLFTQRFISEFGYENYKENTLLHLEKKFITIGVKKDDLLLLSIINKSIEELEKMIPIMILL